MTIDLKPRVRLDLSLFLIPVIFANGEDDDLPGLAAAIRHERVMFDGRVYEPDEDVTVENRELVISRSMSIHGAHCPCACSADNMPDGWVFIREGTRARTVTIQNCNIRLTYQPE